ncbi:MAG: hypothetical protein RR595_09515 [Lysinibacillus sp.]
MDDKDIIEKHKVLDYILHVNDGFLWQDIFRSLGSGLVIMLTWLNNLLEDIVTKIITLNDFYSTGAMGEFMDVARPLVWGVFLIALVVLGFQFMTNKIEKRNEVIMNVIMAVCFIVVIPDLMTNMGKVLNIGIEQMNPEEKTLAGDLVKSNVADVLYYAEKDFQFAGSKNGNQNSPPRPASRENSDVGTTDFTYANRLSGTSSLHVPYLQKLDFHEDDGWIFKEDWVKELSDDTKDVLMKKSVPTGVGNGYQVEELEKNAIPTTKIGRETYYRYHVNWFPLIISLIITTFALTVTIIKIGRAVFDLAFHQIFGMFIAASDLTGGQRTKKILVEMMNTFAVIFIMTLLLQLFILYTTWANGLKGDIGWLGVMLMMIAGAWALIDAPDIVQRMLGIDAGLRNGWQAMMGAYAGAKTASAGAKAIGSGLNAVGEVGKAGVGVSASAANFGKRAVEGMRSETPEEIATGLSGRTSVPNMPGSVGLAEGGSSQNVDIPANSTEIPSSSVENQDGTLNRSNITTPSSSRSETAIPSSISTQATPIVSGIANKGSQGTSQEQAVNQGQASRQVTATVPLSNTMAGRNDTSNTSTIDGSQSVSAIPSSGGTQTASIPLSGGTQTTSIPSSGHTETTSNVAGIGITGTQASGQEQVVDQVEASRQITATVPSASDSIATPDALSINDSQSAASIPSSVGMQTVTTDNGINSNDSHATNQGQAIQQRQSQQVTTARSSGSTTSADDVAVTSSNSQATRKTSVEPKTGPKPHGHKEVVHTNSLLGANRSVQQLKETVTRAGNSGFSLGQNLRRVTKRDRKGNGGDET